MAEQSDWRDGFLFLGNQLALDFLNTRPVMEEGPVELLVDVAALERWLEAAGRLLPRKIRRPRMAEADLRPLWEFRERLREAVVALEAGKPLPAAFLSRLNALLREYPLPAQVAAGPHGLERRTYFEPAVWSDAFAPLLEATVELLTGLDRTRVRQCSSCQLHFHDTSKKGTRRWCSMNICGNRSKVAAYARRKQEAEREREGD